MKRGAELIDILERKIKISRELRVALDEILDHRRGSIWAEEQVSALSNFFSTLNDLDREVDLFELKIDSKDEANRIAGLVRELETQLLSIKPLLAQFQIRLSGGKQAISSSLKELLTSRDIKMYRNGTAPSPQSAGLIC